MIMDLNKEDSIPLYVQLKNIIEHKIVHGELKPNEQIDSERQLCEKYNISRITVRSAILLAVKENLLYRKQGRGTFVKRQKIKQQLERMNKFEQTLAKQGVVATTVILKTAIIQNTFHLSKILHMHMTEQIKNIQLVGFGNDDPIVYYDSYFPLDIGSMMEEAAHNALHKMLPFSTLDLYSESLSLQPTHVEQVFEAVAADAFLSGVLRVAPQAPILLVISIVYADKQPIEYKKAYYRGDQYHFFIKRIFDTSVF